MAEKFNLKQAIIDKFLTDKKEESTRVVDVYEKVDEKLKDLSISSTPKKAALTYGQAINKRSRQYEEMPFDLYEIVKAVHTESYVRQAYSRRIKLLFKEGFHIDSENPGHLDYIRNRLEIMGMIQQQPFELFLLETADNLLKFANTFLVKARLPADANPMIFGRRLTPITGTRPISGYVNIHPATMSITRLKKGGVPLRYKQFLLNGEQQEYKAKDIVHMHTDRETGAAFGYPELLPVIQDIVALREVEEHVLSLIYMYLHPLLHYQVGLKDNVMLMGKEPEIKQVIQECQNMAPEGMLVTSERHNLKLVTFDNILDAVEYLRYFEDRVFTGLGTSKVQMGRTETSTRASSDQMSETERALLKHHQSVISKFIEFYLFNELLWEAGLDPLGEENKVRLVWPEIDSDERIKRENHAIQKWINNITTHDEVREEIGLKPGMADSDQKFIDVVTLPQLEAEIQGKIELEKAKPKPVGGASTSKATPSNQHGKKLSPRSKKTTKNALGEMIPLLYEAKRDVNVSQLMIPHIEEAYRMGIEKAISEHRFPSTLDMNAEDVNSLVLFFNDRTDFLQGELLLSESVHDIHGIIDSQIETLEETVRMTLEKAEHCGYIFACHTNGVEEIKINNCKKCGGTSLQTNAPIWEVPPKTPSCRCRIEVN